MKSYIFIIALFIISILIFSACSKQERFIAEAKLNLEFPKKGIEYCKPKHIHD